MYFPRKDNELDTLCNYLDVQLDALRASAFGLDDDAARRTPLRSALSISGLLKHATFVMVGSLSGAGVAGYEHSQADFAASFTPTAEETLDRILERFDCVRADYMEMCRGGDLEVELPVGPFPWYGMDEPQVAKLRYIYVHAVEEFARHAGHADIIREQIDGAQAAELLAAIEGWEPNEYITPWSE